MDELRLECATRKPDIIVITESWLSTCHDDSIFHIRNYILFRQDRLNKSGGGVAVWINASLHSERLFPTCTSPMGEYLFPIHGNRLLVPFSKTNRRRNCFLVFGALLSP